MGKWSKIFTLKVYKNYFSQVYGHIFGQNVINGVNLVNIGQFGKNGHNWVILAYFVGQNDIKCQNLGGSGQIIIFLIVSTNYFNQVYGKKLG